MSAVREAMLQLSRDLGSAFEASGVYQHSLTKGEAREEVVSKLLRPYLPRRFEISSGEVVNAAGGVSRQQDVVLSDSNAVAPLFTTGRAGVHPVEAVHACLEIKSSVDTRQVVDAVASLATAKSLVSNEPRGFSMMSDAAIGMGTTTQKPFTGILAYSSNATWETIAKAFYAANQQLHPLDRCDALAVVGKFVCVWIDANFGLVFPENAHSLGVKLAGDLSLLIFYVVLYQRIVSYQAPTFDLMKYVAAVELPPEWHTVSSTSA